MLANALVTALVRVLLMARSRGHGQCPAPMPVALIFDVQGSSLLQGWTLWHVVLVHPLCTWLRAASMQVLRGRLGCLLPIEISYHGDDEADRTIIAMMEVGVLCTAVIESSSGMAFPLSSHRS